MKTINLTLTGFTILEVLKMLHDNELIPTYLGTDQNFNLLYKVSYAIEKEDIIKSMLKHMSDYAKMEQDFDFKVEEMLSKSKQTTDLETFIKKPFKNIAFNCLNKIIKKAEHERAEHKD